MLVDVVGDPDGTGRNANIADVSVAGKTGTSQKFDFEKKRYSSQRVKASFLGFLPAEDPRMVILVVLDEPKTQRWGGQAAAPVFRKISEQVLRRFDRDGGMLEYAEDDETLEVTHVVARETRAGDIGVNGSTMPDFRGLTMREVLKIARFIGVDLKIKGSGWAMSQKPAPGTPLEDHSSCRVIFSPRI
jgi:cell division protein FtsI (penicillin-binding protein 3)